MRTQILAVSLLLVGVLYYTVFRLTPGVFHDPTHGSFPSFIFVLAFSLGSATLVKGHLLTKLGYASVWLLLTLTAEVLFGFVDKLDITVAIIGFAVAAALIWKLDTQSVNHSRRNHLWVAGLGVVLLTGSYLPGHLSEEQCCSSDKRAVYLSYADLRSAVSVEAPRPMSAMGNLYLYADRLFINEKNKGLHVINNSDPVNPVPEAFIKIPGNTNVSIRSGYLYADSFIDLVVLDIRDADNLHEINRQIDVFPYDAYQLIEDKTIYLGHVEEDRGVVIGYE